MVAQARMVVRKLRNTNNREIPVSEDFKRAVFFICFTPTVQGTEEQRQKRHGTWYMVRFVAYSFAVEAVRQMTFS